MDFQEQTLLSFNEKKRVMKPLINEDILDLFISHLQGNQPTKEPLPNLKFSLLSTINHKMRE